MATEFKLPELGENIEQGDLVRLMVSPGANISEGQPVMELETDKAVIEVPSSVSGVVKDIRVKEGEKIKVGQTIFTIENGAGASAAKPEAQPVETGGSAAQDMARTEVQTLRRDEGKSEQEALPPDEPLPPEPPKAAPAKPAPRQAAPPERPTAPPAPVAGGATEFKLPELGENISEGDLVRVMIAPGKHVSEGQPVIELETDKAVVEVPSTVTGVVKDVRAKEGQKVKVGQVIFTLEGSAPVAPEPERPQPVAHLEEQEAARHAYQAAIKAEGKEEHEALPRDGAPAPQPTFELPPQLLKTAGPEHGEPIPAAPNVRRLARELGIDIYQVKGSGPGGRITKDDVKAFTKATIASIPAIAAAQAPGLPPAPQLPDFSKWGKIERVSMRGIRRKTAEHLWQAWTNIPHVTQHDKADITELEQLRARFAPRAEQAGGKMTVTAIALKICASALKVFPQFNASIDMKSEEIVYKQYINIGVAVDTDRGLLVPVIRDVDKKNITELAVELAQIGKKAREKKLAPEDMEGGTFTITNLGGLGGTAFTPIVNHPEVAILGMSRSRMEPVWNSKSFEPRLMLPVSLSYDHRLIDGADAVRFLRWIVEALEQPFLLSVQG
ncbi:MAG TPA: dihydrolipoyllysine-residue acetyltransferase [Terriglobales bacterium]|nr:dihydrolipoyllysine-residue acetyltransferase [Terriglobales bacterium]